MKCCDLDEDGSQVSTQNAWEVCGLRLALLSKSVAVAFVLRRTRCLAGGAMSMQCCANTGQRTKVGAKGCGLCLVD